MSNSSVHSFKNYHSRKGRAKTGGRKGRLEDEGNKGRVKSGTHRKGGSRGTVGDLKPRGEILKKRRVKKMHELARKRKTKGQTSGVTGRSKGRKR